MLKAFIFILCFVFVFWTCILCRESEDSIKENTQKEFLAMFDCGSKRPFSTDLNLQGFEVRVCKTKKGVVQYLLVTTPDGGVSLSVFNE
jgi:hypothetical protein